MNENTDIGDAAVLTLPVVALRDIIVFPHMTVNLDIGRKESIEAVRAAGRSDRDLAMIMQRDGKVEVPQEEDLYSFGTVVKVKQMLQLPGGLIRIQAEGISRIRVHSVLRKENCLVSQVEDVPEIEPSDALRGEAYRRALLKSFFEWIHNAQQNLSDEQMEQPELVDQPLGPVGGGVAQPRQGGQAAGDSGSLGVNHAGGEGGQLFGALGRTVGQSLAELIGQPPVQVRQSVGNAPFAGAGARGGALGRGGRPGRVVGPVRGLLPCGLLPGPLDAALQPLGGEGGRLPTRHLPPAPQVQQADGMFAGELAAGAGTLEGRAGQIHAHPIGPLARPRGTAPHQRLVHAGVRPGGR